MSSYRRLIFLFFGVLHTSNFAYGYPSNQKCRTPDGIESTCVDLGQCEPMLTLLNNIKPPHPPAVIKRLRSYMCGGIGRKVCCPQEPIVLDPTTLYHNREVAPDVTGHRNYHLLPERCGYLDSSIKVTGGQDADLNEFRWMALLRYQTSSGLQFLCGGTIINYNYILTAAHCLGSEEGKLVSVRVGEHSIKNKTDCQVQDVYRNTIVCNPPVQDLKVEEIIPHPQYVKRGNNLLNDIALLRVSRISEANNTYPVCLPVGELKDWPTVNGKVIGWGVKDPLRQEPADVLQKLDVPITDRASCAASYSKYGMTLTKTQICAGGEMKKGSCPGDSGGPLFVAAYRDGNFVSLQHGIVSAGPKFCGNGYPSIFTMVKFYTDWILDNMRP